MLKIRLARPEDAALLNQMANASYRHHFAHLWHNADEMEHYLQQEYSMAALAHSLADPQCCWLIAEAARPLALLNTLVVRMVIPRSSRHAAA
jgi:hypothetical protein